MSAQPTHRIRSMLDQPADPNVFDTRTHFFDAAGVLVKTNFYTLRVIEGEQYFERPINSGNLWTANNLPAGRLVKREKADPRLGAYAIDAAAPHIAYSAPLEGDEALHYELESEKAQNVELKTRVETQQAQLDAITRELAQIRNERAAARPAQAQSEIGKPGLALRAEGKA
jgi:hypothetical protein